MLSHSKLILFLLIVILTVMICIYHPFSKKKIDSNQENFENYITSIHAKRYNVNDIIDPAVPKVVVDEACAPGLAPTNLDILKNRMIYAKFCYQTKPHIVNRLPERNQSKFVNNFYQGETNNINQKPVENDHNLVMRSHSDYLGCYKLFDGDGKENTTVNPKTATIGTGTNNIQFNTLENIKSANKSSKVFMSGEIRDDLESKGLFTDKNIPKSLGGPLTDKQFEKLTNYATDTNNNLRIPDKYCLGRVRMEHDRVIEYLGGVNAIAVYGNDTKVEDEKRKPPVFIRDHLIVNDRPCMDYVNIECVINFKKHVVCDYNMIGNFWADVREFDSQKIIKTNIQEQATSHTTIRDFYRTWTVEGFKEKLFTDLQNLNLEKGDLTLRILIRETNSKIVNESKRRKIEEFLSQYGNDSEFGFARGKYPGFSATTTKVLGGPGTSRAVRQRFDDDMERTYGKQNSLDNFFYNEFRNLENEGDGGFRTFWTSNVSWNEMLQRILEIYNLLRFRHLRTPNTSIEILRKIIDKLILIEKKSSSVPHRNIILDRSGNENHMILDYNYLHFIGAFDLRSNFNNISDYNAWLTNLSNFTESKTEDKLRNLTDENIIISRYKNHEEINKAKYMVRKYNSEIDELNTSENLYFSENYGGLLSGLKYDSMVMRGLCNEWPYLGMIGWLNDETNYKPAGTGANVQNFSVDGDQIGINVWCVYGTKYPKARPADNDKLIGRAALRDSENIRNRTFYLMKDSTSGGHHDCTCTGTDGKYRCDHIGCLKYSFLKSIHTDENPNPMYVSVSVNNTRNILQFYEPGRDTLFLRSKPTLQDEEKAKNTKYFFKDPNNVENDTVNSNKFFMRTSNTIKNEFKKEFMCVFSYLKNVKIENDDPTNIFSVESQKFKVSHHNYTGGKYLKYGGMIGNPILSYCSNFRSEYDKNEIKPDTVAGQNQNVQYNQAFMWSYMRNFKLNDNTNYQDGLVFIKPKKVKSIVFLANKGRLSLGKITIYNLNGDIINFKNGDPSFKILKYDQHFVSEEDTVLTTHEKFNEVNQSYEEHSFLFTINPIQFILKQTITASVVGGVRRYQATISGINSRYIEARSNPYIKITASNKPVETVLPGEQNTSNILQMERTLKNDISQAEGFFISPYSEKSHSQKEGGGGQSSTEQWVGPTTNFKIEREGDDTKGKITVFNVVSNHGFDFFPKFEIPATKNDFYMLKFIGEDSHYISRIVVECGIQDVQNRILDYNDKYFFDTTVNYYLENNFEKVTMNLYDETETAKILAGTTLEEENRNLITENIFSTGSKPTPINSINFRTKINISPDSQDWEAGFKNSVVDFYNYDFIPDPRPDTSRTNRNLDKNVAIICQKHSNPEKARNNFYELYLKSSTDGNTVGKSRTVDIHQSYLNSITSNNYNVKVGNLFYNHNELEMKRLTIYRNTFFEDLKDIIEAERTSRTKKKYDYLNEMIDKIIIHKQIPRHKNPYTLVHNEIKKVIKTEGIERETDIFEILKSVDSDPNFERVNGSFLKYKLDNALGYLDLDGTKTPQNSSGYQEIYEGIYTKSFYDE